MALLAALNHITHYRYDRPIALGMQTVRLRPAPHTRSHVQSYSLKVQPEEHFINWQQDPFGNYLARLVFPKKVSELRIEVDLVTEIRVFNPFDFFLEEYARQMPSRFAYEPLLAEELTPYLEIKENGPLLSRFMGDVPRSTQDMISFLVSLNQMINQRLKYIVRMEPGVQTCEETLSLGSGSCRDMAWLLCQILRHLGLAARFASGYLIQLVADIKPLEGPAGTEVDFTDLHAWTEVYLPGAGWVGLDPTSGLFTGEGHIPLCCTPSPMSAAPVSGTLEPCDATLEHRMSVTRINDSARITRPFTDQQWQQVDALGQQIDASLKVQDVRLTMGGEPTFVSIDDREGTEWNFTALSDTKHKLAAELFLRLRQRFYPGSLVQYTQGKWYPGEILPRWAMLCFTRKDGEKIWDNDSLLAEPQKNYGHTHELAGRFATELAKTLGIDATCALSAHEDAGYYLWKEQKLPAQGDLASSDPFEAAERKKIQSLFSQSKGEPAGYVLPLHFSPARKRWISNRWEFRTPQMVLLTGDSPLGLRLPLASLPAVPLPSEEECPPRSPLDQADPLPARAELLALLASRSSGRQKADKDPSGMVRTALCTEVRNGTLHVFLPPLVYAEHFLELVAAVESVAAQLKTHLIIEGYAPPSDLRLSHFSVTPDPGVIEVNVQPAASWNELKTITEGVYDDARQSRLTAEKFLLDGRRVGTGGGNHIVLGGATPDDSPFLRRPDLLQSLITFWQHHPSLSYLFSSMYIGPTSQSPRIDEARHDSLYELEIAFAQLAQAKDTPTPPWLVDRLFRNLLVDITGNTHRAEFCIDKLYSPDSHRGRLGLLELRGFEMSPHARMNLLQALLIRACVATFWKTPYNQPLKRWGTALHDRFMMPYFVSEDLKQALATLKSGGFDIRHEWFDAFFDFRFPHYGSIDVGGTTLSLRMALEPWPVLGEEMGASGVSRSVDSSVERLQVLVSGLDNSRQMLTCNGLSLPLHPTGVPGEYVAAVRYKAWKPPSSLHPTIDVHTPLVFDVLDIALERSLGGCKYHVMHPGGRGYDTIPVNENEAEGRRLSRFEAMGHTPGRMQLPPRTVHPEFPLTLDLRLHRP